MVGFASGVIAALEGANVTLVGYDGPDRVARSAEEIGRRFGVQVKPADGSAEDRKGAILEQAEAAFCAGRAGVQIIDAALLSRGRRLLAVADVNAVPPLGVAGLEVNADGARSDPAALGLGALAIGQTKYRTEFGLFRRMIEAEKPVRLDFRDAFALARELAA